MHTRWLLALFLLFAVAMPSVAAESEAVRSPRAIATLVSETDAPAPGKPFRVGLRLRMAPGWHTYWRNPGDAGVPPEISLSLPVDAKVSDIAWPAPERLPEGPIMTYGYTGEVLLPVTITPGTAIGTLEARASWLICEKICVPEEGVFRLTLAVGAGAPSAQAELFAAADRAMPRPFAGTARMGPDGSLTVQAPELTGGAVAEAWFFPETPGMIAHSKPQVLSIGADGLRLRMTPANDFKPGTTIGGVLMVTDRAGLHNAFSLTAAPGEVTVAPRIPLVQAVLFAFLGGLLLNLMPCVFPVLAMKAVSLAGFADKARGAARVGAAFYTLGILVAFAILAGALLAARQAGAAVGWGFQFQSPVFVAVMAWVLFAIGLNLSGVFQVQTRLAGAGQGIAARGGALGSFATGLLAAVVATPCTAPFMGAAIAAALTASVPVMMAVFLAMGLGLAAPYVAVAVVPGLARMLPRPGGWMDVLKQILAFPMYAASAWMVWVMSQALGPSGVLVVLTGLLLVGFAGWALGLAQGSAGRRVGRVLAVVAVVIALALLPGLAAQEPAMAAAADAGTEAFSPSRLAALRAEGRPVFVNMTAAWCITCLVNERIALAPAAVRAAFTRERVAYLKGDWTRQDAAITAFLRAHGRDGVPLYVFYPPGGEGMVLPQILTEGTMLAAIAAK